MKIENGYSNYLQSVRRTQNEKATETKKQEAPKQEEAVSIQISEEAKILSETAGQTEVSARAQEIKKALADGTYKVSSKDISKGLLKAVHNQKGF